MSNNKTLSVSIIEGEYHYLEIERKGGGIFAGAAQTATSLEALLNACRRVDQVHINSTFPTTTYNLATIPKVARKYIGNLVAQDAAEKMGLSGGAMVQHGVPAEINEGGVDKWRLAYVAVAEDEIRKLWQEFAVVHRKIKQVTPMPVAAAAMVASLGKPEGDFVLVWVGTTTSLILIASAGGVVYMARTVPLGMERRKLNLAPGAAPAVTESVAPAADSEAGLALELDSPSSPEAAAAAGNAADEMALSLETETAPEPELTPDARLVEDFRRVLEKEINMTITFFKQEFRQPPPQSAFILGNSNLPAIITDSDIADSFATVKHDLDTSKIRGLSAAAAAENLALLGNMFLGENFNFLPPQEIVRRKTTWGLNMAVAATVLAVAGATLWVNQLHLQRSDLLRDQQVNVNRLQGVQDQLAAVQSEVNRLKPLEGWKNFHDSVFVRQPAWDRFVSEIALMMDDNIILDNFQVMAGSGSGRDCRIQGSVRARDWEDGLVAFREFGSRLQGSPIFEVRNLDYKPEAIQSSPRVYGFQIDLRLTGGKDNEA